MSSFFVKTKGRREFLKERGKSFLAGLKNRKAGSSAQTLVWSQSFKKQVKGFTKRLKSANDRQAALFQLVSFFQVRWLYRKQRQILKGMKLLVKSIRLILSYEEEFGSDDNNASSLKLLCLFLRRYEFLGEFNFVEENWCNFNISSSSSNNNNNSSSTLSSSLNLSASSHTEDSSLFISDGDGRFESDDEYPFSSGLEDSNNLNILNIENIIHHYNKIFYSTFTVQHIQNVHSNDEENISDEEKKKKNLHP